jgi:transposase InsO family protein
VADITFIRTDEGWLYMAVVIDLYARLVVGWSMCSRITRELVMDATNMAIWHQRPAGRPVVTRCTSSPGTEQVASVELTSLPQKYLALKSGIR